MTISIVIKLLVIIVFCALFTAMMIVPDSFTTPIFIAFLCFIILNFFFEENHKPSESSSCQYEITVNEKSFKTSDFKTKSDGSIEFTANDGTVIRASEYEIKKLN